MRSLLIASLLLLSSCGGPFIKADITEPLPQLVTQEATEYVVPTIDISPYLLEDCEPLVVLNPSASFEDVLTNHADAVSKYHLCREKHKTLKTIIKKSLEAE